MQSSHILVLLIIIIVFGAKLINTSLKQRFAGSKHVVDEDVEKMTRRIEELEQRVRVLEQIVTDPKESLSRQINGL